MNLFLKFLKFNYSRYFIIIYIHAKKELNKSIKLFHLNIFVNITGTQCSKHFLLA